MDRMIYLVDDRRQGDHAAPGRAGQQPGQRHRRTGFRAELAAFRAVPVQRRRRQHARLRAGVHRRLQRRCPGAVAATGRNLDVAMQGNAWLAVQGARRHRGLHARRRARGRRRRHAGHRDRPAGARRRRADHGARRTPRSRSRADGTRQRQVRQRHAASRRPAEAGDARKRRCSAATTACSAPPTGDLPADANARVQDGALEGSNVSAVETMVAMIAAARQFEQQMKMLQSAEDDERPRQAAGNGYPVREERRQARLSLLGAPARRHG